MDARPPQVPQITSTGLSFAPTFDEYEHQDNDNLRVTYGLVFTTLVDELKSALLPQLRLEEVTRIIQQVIRDDGVPTGDRKMSVNVWARVDQVMPLGRVTEEVCLVSSSIQPPKLRTPTGYVKKEGQEPDLLRM